MIKTESLYIKYSLSSKYLHKLGVELVDIKIKTVVTNCNIKTKENELRHPAMDGR